MARFEFAGAARADIARINEFTSERWGREQAHAYLDALYGRLAELAERPGLGRRRDELAEGLLWFPFESHVIFYQVMGSGIVVVRILHSRQEARRHLR